MLLWGSHDGVGLAGPRLASEAYVRTETVCRFVSESTERAAVSDHSAVVATDDRLERRNLLKTSSDCWAPGLGFRPRKSVPL